ncbi:MAG TPA: hypothetical protein VL689_21485 [Paraburkholderia sp.]|jgi:hypothetical protein|nr:hypothetical protein [Paraburkholderia sp.]
MATIPQITSISKFHGGTTARRISHAIATIITIKTISTKTLTKR